MPEVQPLCPLRLKKSAEEKIRRGMPWAYASDIIESSELLLAPAGSLVSIESPRGQFIGIGYFNAGSQIACRVLSLKKEPIDGNFFKGRLEKALRLREKHIAAPYYRLAHSEGDFLPGLIIDRVGGIAVAQAGTAGMNRLEPLWLEALDEVLRPKTVLLRNDSASRTLEGLAQQVRVIKGEVPELVEVHENGCVYFADLRKGQKTGWFYDQRDNRNMIAQLARGKTVLDAYCHSGGFGVLAAKEGAREVTMADSSKLALELAMKAAEKNGVAARCEIMQGDAFDIMQSLAEKNRQYDVVVADPPAFVKSRKDLAAGMKGYEKIARLAAALVNENGTLFVASCSHHAPRARFNQSVVAGASKAGRTAAILRQTGAGADHPRHPQLPQNDYLKGVLASIGCP